MTQSSAAHKSYCFVDLSNDEEDSCASCDTQESKRLKLSTQFLPKDVPVSLPLELESKGLVHTIRGVSYNRAEATQRTATAQAAGASDLVVCLQHWRNREAQVQTSISWSTQTEVTPHMRQVLVAWLCDVSHEFRMMRETFFLAINYLDRYLGKSNVTRTKFQLVGIACLWLAAKFEEVRPPLAVELLEMTDNTYEMSQLLAMESDILSCLNFDLSPPTVLKFMDYHKHVVNICSGPIALLAAHLLELSTLATNGAARGDLSPVAAAITDHASSQGACKQPFSQDFGPDSVTANTADATGMTPSPTQPSEVHSTPTSSERCRTPEQGGEALVSPRSRQPAAFAAAALAAADLAHVGAALPSHVAAAALFAAVVMHNRQSKGLLLALAGSAVCDPRYIVCLAQGLRGLHVKLCSEAVPVGMVERYQTQGAKLRNQLEHAVLMHKFRQVEGALDGAHASGVFHQRL